MSEKDISWTKFKMRYGGYKILGFKPEFKIPEDLVDLETYVDDLIAKNSEVISVQRLINYANFPAPSLSMNEEEPSEEVLLQFSFLLNPLLIRARMDLNASRLLSLSHLKSDEARTLDYAVVVDGRMAFLMTGEDFIYSMEPVDSFFLFPAIRNNFTSLFEKIFRCEVIPPFVAESEITLSDVGTSHASFMISAFKMPDYKEAIEAKDFEEALGNLFSEIKLDLHSVYSLFEQIKELQRMSKNSFYSEEKQIEYFKHFTSSSPRKVVEKFGLLRKLRIEVASNLDYIIKFQNLYKSFEKDKERISDTWSSAGKILWANTDEILKNWYDELEVPTIETATFLMEHIRSELTTYLVLTGTLIAAIGGGIVGAIITHII